MCSLISNHFCVRFSILEAFVQAEGYDYRRLDGTTPTDARVEMVDEFNREASIFVFLISTRQVHDQRLLATAAQQRQKRKVPETRV